MIPQFTTLYAYGILGVRRWGEWGWGEGGGGDGERWGGDSWDQSLELCHLPTKSELKWWRPPRFTFANTTEDPDAVM